MIRENDLKLLTNYRRLKHIKRCNNFPTLVPENVAEHSYYVALTALTLVEEYNRYVDSNNLKYHPMDDEHQMIFADVHSVLKRALFHDMEEAFTSDIPYNVKHHDSEVYTALKSTTRKILGDVYENSTPIGCSHKYCIEHCKDGLEGAFVAVADLLEGAWYCCEEINFGNKTIRGLLQNYYDILVKSELHATFMKTCPTFKALMELFYDTLLMTPRFNPERELFV